MGKGKRIRALRKENPKSKSFDGLSAGDKMIIPKKATGQDPIIITRGGNIITSNGVIKQ